MSIKIMNSFLMTLTKKILIAEKGKEFYKKFKYLVQKHLNDIIPQVPEIGDSIFKSSYLMGVFFIAWYKAFIELGVSSDEANRWIWIATENALKRIPDCFIPMAKKIYLGGMLKKADVHTIKSKAGQVPEFDWSIEYVKIDNNSFRLDTYECGIKKLCEKFSTEKMLPSMCRMDYLTAHYLKHDFQRTQTLVNGHLKKDLNIENENNPHHTYKW